MNGARPAAEIDALDLDALTGDRPADDTAGALVLRLDRFEGPLDLLLHLIKRDEIDIYDIPIARITAQYLAYLDLLRRLDLEVAGEYLVMAATLVRIKARLLLPSPADEEEDDPRDQLVQRLLEYRQFKEAAEELKKHETRRRSLVARGYIPTPESEAAVELVPVSLFTLLDVVAEVLTRRREEFFHRVERERVTVEETMQRLLDRLVPTGRLLFREVLEVCEDRIEMVTALMGLLELARLGEVEVAQDELFGEVWIFRATPAVDDGEVNGIFAIDPDQEMTAADDQARPTEAHGQERAPDEDDVMDGAPAPAGATRHVGRSHAS
jgi:segregation and condensation protein A